MEDVFTVEDLQQSEKYGYFAARRFAERFISNFEAAHFKPLIDKFTKQFNDKLWSDASDSLIGDTKYNVHGEVARMVQGTVQAILSGEKWALDRYPLASGYDSEKVREAIAKHIPKELQDARISDLQSRVTKLTEDVRFYREHR